jgi:citrate lyase subunit beta/citryl-CoA lyase
VAVYNDLEGIEKSAAEARTFGFDGASCVHPAVVPILNRAFAPSDQEVDYALRLLAADKKARAAGHGAFEFEGKMVDEPVVRRTRALLERR